MTFRTFVCFVATFYLLCLVVAGVAYLVRGW